MNEKYEVRIFIRTNEECTKEKLSRIGDVAAWAWGGWFAGSDHVPAKKAEDRHRKEAA
jgi:hypothetical protein